MLQKKKLKYFFFECDIDLFQSHWSVKSWPMSHGFSVCSKSLSKILTMEVLTLAAIAATEKYLFVDRRTDIKVTGA